MKEPRPLVLVADPDPKIAVDLRSKLAAEFAEEFDVIETNSERHALQILREAQATKRSVAMVVACVQFKKVIDEAPRIDPMVRVIASSGSGDRDEALEAAATDRAHEATLSGNPFDLDLGPTAKNSSTIGKVFAIPKRTGSSSLVVPGQSELLTPSNFSNFGRFLT